MARRQFLRLAGVCGGRIYHQNEAGVGFVVKSGKTFTLLAQNDLAERTLASYAVADDAFSSAQNQICGAWGNRMEEELPEDSTLSRMLISAPTGARLSSSIIWSCSATAMVRGGNAEDNPRVSSLIQQVHRQHPRSDGQPKK